MTLSGVFSTTGITWVCDSGVSTFIVPVYIFDFLLFLGVTDKFFLVGYFYGFFCAPDVFTMGVPPQ